MSDALAALSRVAGILPRYTDQTGAVHQTGPDTQRALLAAMGLPVRSDAQASTLATELDAREADRALPRWLILRPGAASDLPVAVALDWHIALDDGSTLEGRGPALPPLPLGIHRLTLSGQETTLLCAPQSAPQPHRGWGVTLPLWGLRGPERAGLGDYNDLRETGLALARHGAGFAGINPVHAGFPEDPANFSPYAPSHRRFLNVLHIASEEGGAAAGPLVDYSSEIPAKRAALRAAYGDFRAAGDRAGFESFLAERGAPLRLFATHQALSARHGPYWTNWADACRRPETAPIAGLEGEIRYHAWLQWRAETQLAEAQHALIGAGMRHGLYLDLAVGTHPAGAETWADRQSFALGASLGAPPDAFAPEGQTWNLAPLNPLALTAGHFATFAETLRAQLRHAGLLRIDHILGFERAFWVPDEAGLPGAYVQMPRDALLAVTRIEATRAGASIVGEDLGNIPSGLRTALAASGILGCRVMQFEQNGDGWRDPAAYGATTLASFGTHDLPTYRGWRNGTDIAEHRRLKHLASKAAATARADRTTRVAAFDQAAGGAGADTMHGYLGGAASVLVALQAEDILDVKDQTNLPGTVHEYPNWRRRLPLAGRKLGADPRLARAARIMEKEGR